MESGCPASAAFFALVVTAGTALRYDGAQTIMILSAFSFGVSWVVYALVFFAITAFFPQFHSAHHETVFKIGLGIGFFDAAMLRIVKTANFKIHWIGLLLITILVDWGLILLTDSSSEDYYIEGHLAPIIAAILLGAIAVGFDFIKNRILADVRI